MTNFCFFEIWECPDKPTSKGKYVGASPISEQAFSAVERHNAESKRTGGKMWFIKGVRNNGERVTFL